MPGTRGGTRSAAVEVERAIKRLRVREDERQEKQEKEKNEPE